MTRTHKAITTRRYDDHIANALGMSVAKLKRYPFEIGERINDKGAVVGWHILWSGRAPALPFVYGTCDIRWSDVPVAPGARSEGRSHA